MMAIIDGSSKNYQNFKNDFFSFGSLIAFSTRKFVTIQPR